MAILPQKEEKQDPEKDHAANNGAPDEPPQPNQCGHPIAESDPIAPILRTVAILMKYAGSGNILDKKSEFLMQLSV